jgi:hypothetical protein
MGVFHYIAYITENRLYKPHLKDPDGLVCSNNGLKVSMLIKARRLATMT